MRRERWTLLLAVLLLLAACAGDSDDKHESKAVSGAAQSAAATPAAQASPRPSLTPVEYTRLEKYIPTDDELPDRVVYQKKFDLSNEAAAGNPTELQSFRAAGRLTGIQATLSVEAGARTISVGISYYNNTGEPKKLLRQSGDPAATSAPGRFPVTPVGDEYIAQRLQLGSGEAAAHVINIAWVRGPFFISLADLGGAADTPTDLAVRLAKLIDDRIKANPTP